MGPSFFDMGTICSYSANGVTTTSSSVTTSSSSSQIINSGGVSLSSQTCNLCYKLNPACSGSGNAGISVFAFSVDSQGEADDLIQGMFNLNLIADVNFVSSQTSRKFQVYGAVTSDSSQVRVELVTSDSKAQEVVSKVQEWRQANSKDVKGPSNDTTVTPLSGGSGEYINFVLKQTSTSTLRAFTPEPTPISHAQLDDIQAPNASLVQSISGFY